MITILALFLASILAVYFYLDIVQTHSRTSALLAWQKTELTAKMFARWIFICQTFMIATVPLIVVLLVPPELFEQLDWESLSKIADGNKPRTPITVPMEEALPREEFASALVSLRTFAGWLVPLFQYLFFGAYGFGWGNKR